MATRQQAKGTGLGIQYEDLIPKSEWKDQPEATILTINLPGFAKEQIKVTYVHTSKMIRVTGERPVADRKWSRFNEVFTVPTNCIVDKIHGSFKNNVLTITMPKETITNMANLPEASITVPATLEKLEEKEKIEEAEQKKKLLEEREGLIMKLQEEAKAKEKAEVMKKLQEEAKAKEKAEVLRKLQEEVKAKEKAELMRKLQEEAKEREKAEVMRKLQEEAKAREKAEMMRKLQEEAKAREKAEERKLVEEDTLVKIQERKFADELGGKEKILKPEERKLPEVVYTKSGPGSGSKSGSGGVREVVKSAEEKLGYLEEKGKKIGKGIMEKIREKEKTSEEKKLMVNVGVAALVIFALGAYVSYSFCSSSSTKPE